jgi:hypothetical protein
MLKAGEFSGFHACGELSFKGFNAGVGAWYFGFHRIVVFSSIGAGGDSFPPDIGENDLGHGPLQELFLILFDSFDRRSKAADHHRE